MNINISGEVVRTSQLPKRIIGLGDYLVALNSSPLETSTVLVSDFVSFLNTQFATSLASLTDVSINGPLVGQALVYDGSRWVNQGIGELDTLNSVTTRGNTTTNNITVGTLYFGNASHYLVTDNASYAMLSSNRTLQLATSGNPVLSVFTSQNVGIGTTTDSGFKLDVNGSSRIIGAAAGTLGSRVLTLEGSLPELFFKDTSSTGSGFSLSKYGSIFYFVNTTSAGVYTNYAGVINPVSASWSLGHGGNPLGTVHIKGTGSTSATTSLLVQNSSATPSLTVLDNGLVSVGTSNTGVIMKNNGGYPSLAFWESVARWTIQREGSDVLNFVPNTTHAHGVISFVPGVYTGGVAIGSDTYQHASQLKPASAILSLYAESQGFLQPRLSTSQKNSIVTPATGLQLYDTTNNKNLLYNGTLWQNIATETWVAGQGYLTSTPTLDQVVTAGNSVSNNGITITRASGATLTLNPGSSDNAIVINNSGFIKFASGVDSFIRGSSTTFSVLDASYVSKVQFHWGGSASWINTGGNLLIGTYTDAGYKLDVNGTSAIRGTVDIVGGTLRIASTGPSTQPSYITSHSDGGWNFTTYTHERGAGVHNFTSSNGNASIFSASARAGVNINVSDLSTGNPFSVSGTVTASSAIARGQWINTTLAAAANNDVLVGLDINPTFTNGAFTGVNNYNIRTGGLVTKQYFQSPTTNQGSHTIAFGFGGAGEQVKLIASAAGSTGRGNLYIATATGDSAIATTADANALFANAGNTFYKLFDINQNTLTTGNGLYLTGNQPSAITNGIYFRFGETRVAILSKPHGASGYADFRIAIVPLGSATPNNPPQESDTKFMITKDTTNVLINTVTDSGYKLDVNGSFISRGNAAFVSNLNTSSFFSTSGIHSDGRMALYGTTTDGTIQLLAHRGANSGGSAALFPGSVNAGGGLTGAIGLGPGGLSIQAYTIGTGGINAGTHKSLAIGTPNTSVGGFGGVADTIDFGTYSCVSNSWSGIRPAIRYTALSHEFRVDNTTGQFNPGTSALYINSSGNVGIGTTTPTYKLDVVGDARIQKSNGANLYLSETVGNAGDVSGLYLTGNNSVWGGSIRYNVGPGGAINRLDFYHSLTGLGFSLISTGNVAIGTTTDNGYKLQVNGNAFIKGSGTTSGTNSLLVQNGSGNSSLTIFDDRSSQFGGSVTSIAGGFITTGSSPSNDSFYTLLSGQIKYYVSLGGYLKSTSQLISNTNGAGTINASAILQVDSTTQGFLKPRLTSVEKNAITTPATGLEVYDSTTNTPNYYNGTTWVGVASNQSTGLSPGLFAQTSDSTPVANTTVETTLISTGVGTLSVPANQFQVGASYVAYLSGVISSQNNATLEIHLRSNGFVLADTNPMTLSATTGKFWELHVNFTVRAIGAGGVAAIVTSGRFSYNKDSGNIPESVGFSNINNTTFDTTINNTLTITATWGSASPLNSIYTRIFNLYRVY